MRSKSRSISTISWLASKNAWRWTGRIPFSQNSAAAEAGSGMFTMRDGPTRSPAPALPGLPDSLFRSLFDANPLPMWISDARTQSVITVNERALQYFGCCREQFLAAPPLAIEAIPEPGNAPVHEGDSVLRHYRKPDGTSLAMRLETSNVEVDGRAALLVVAIDATAESRALAENARYRTLFDAASDWFWMTGTGSRLTYISPNFEALYGIPAAALLGRRLIEHPSVRIDAEMGAKIIAAIKAREPQRDILYAHDFADGRTVWVKTNAIPIFDAAGAYCGYWGLSKDVTAEIEAERVLRESEEQFRHVLEASADCYWEQDEEYRNIYLSPSYEKLLGIPIASSLGVRHSEIPGISFEPEMGMMVLRAQRRKQPYRDFIYCHETHGRKHWIKTSAAPTFDRNGAFRGYRGVGIEITQQVEAEAAARLAQQRMKEAVAHVSQPIVVYDTEDRVVSFNQAFADLHQAPNSGNPVCQGASFRELAEWQLSIGFYGDGPDDRAVDLETLLAAHLSEAEETYRLRDGRWMQVVYRPLPGESRVGLWTDVTALKRAEADRRALERQVHHAQRLEALGTLAGGVAHEINNALVPVIALTTLVARKLPAGSLERRNLATVLAGAERSRDLLKQILGFSRKETEGRRSEKIDVEAVLREALQMMRATLPTSIRVMDDIAPAPLILGDPGQIQQVIVNLMTNAAHAIGRAQGMITVRLHPDAPGSQLCLSVADTGCGMGEATLARIFEPFFTTKPVGEGTGLGLSVVHGIIQGHGGRIEVTSTPGQGTRFDVMLPVPPR
jgi:PAS domain S-box-containing protein